MIHHVGGHSLNFIGHHYGLFVTLPSFFTPSLRFMAVRGGASSWIRPHLPQGSAVTWWTLCQISWVGIGWGERWLITFGLAHIDENLQLDESPIESIESARKTTFVDEWLIPKFRTAEYSFDPKQPVFFTGPTVHRMMTPPSSCWSW